MLRLPMLFSDFSFQRKRLLILRQPSNQTSPCRATAANKNAEERRGERKNVQGRRGERNNTESRGNPNNAEETRGERNKAERLK